ncbi:hypothetical protein WA026_016001 [Henosepilachna vigintioctopunctata]|uniref:E3 ubiquitin-protein ligase FANCL n=1 Tax=Henosepilachna vigintioctopunctata TaxID=420089 RepID=A0AAW1U3B6_9CUCU
MEINFIELLSKHPTFKWMKNGESIIYSGTIIVNADRYKITVKETSTNGNKKFELLDNDNVLTKFNDHLQKLKGRKVKNVTTFIDGVAQTIEENSNFPKNYCGMYITILQEYEEFTKFFIDLKSCSLSSDLTSIKASSCDAKGREHSVEIGIDFKEVKDIFYFKNYDLPEDKKKSLSMKSSSLIEFYNSYLGYIEGLQIYFDLLEMLDEFCKVIDPSDQSRRNNFRRIWLGDNVCVTITLDPFNVNTCPNFAFFGPDRLVNDFRNTLNDNLKQWDNNEDVFHGILNMLGLEKFPGKQTHSLSPSHNIELLKEDGDCSICFCSNLNNKLPEIVCNNKCCENFYHKDCLYEWLLSINSKKIFNEVQGPCPNCEKLISCPIPE